jgi:hypothetical protein
MDSAVFNLLFAVLDYSPMRPEPNPTAGFLLAGFALCMFISSGVWGALAPILPRDVAIRGALATGALLFVAVATLGFCFLGRAGHGSARIRSLPFAGLRAVQHWRLALATAAQLRPRILTFS